VGGGVVGLVEVQQLPHSLHRWASSAADLPLPSVTCPSRDGNTLAWPVPLPNMTLQQLMLSPPDASSSSSSSSNAGRSRSSLLLNTCSSEVLAELLRHLKRSYWPFSWDTSLGASSGGFRSAGNGRGSCM
jgi:hypothetical protein